jgi:hypothetical protein
MRASKFAAGIYRFGTIGGELGSFLSRARNVIFDIFFAILADLCSIEREALESRCATYRIDATTMSSTLCGVCNAEPKKYKCPTCALP